MTDAHLSITLIDDDQLINLVNRKVISRFDSNIRVSTFTHPLEALEYLKHAINDFIFLDINITGVTAWKLLEKMDEDQIDNSVVILSSGADDQDRKKALSYSKVKAFLSKPLTAEALQQVISQR